MTRIAVTVEGDQPSEWSELEAEAPLFARSSWLRIMGDRLGGTSAWLVARDAGRPLAGLYGRRLDAPNAYFLGNPYALLLGPNPLLEKPRPVEDALAALRRRAPSPERHLPALAVTYPGAECFAAGPARDDETVLGELVGGAAGWAEASGLALVAFLFVSEDEPALGRALEERGFLRFPVGLRADLRLPGTSFEDYLATLDKKTRSNVGRLRRRLAEAGIEIRPRPPLECADDFARLRARHQRRYGHAVDEAVERERFERLARELGDSVTVYAAVAGEETLGLAVLIADGDTWHGFWAVTADDPRTKGVYFELAYHTPIEAAYELGYPKLSVGYGAREAKEGRAFELSPSFGFVLPLREELTETAAAAAALLSDLVPAASS